MESENMAFMIQVKIIGYALMGKKWDSDLLYSSQAFQ